MWSSVDYLEIADLFPMQAQIAAKKNLVKEFKKLREQLYPNNHDRVAALLYKVARSFIQQKIFRLAANFALIASIQQTESSTVSVTGL